MMTTPARLLPLLFLALATATRSTAQTRPAFAGSWELNPEKSASSTSRSPGGYNRGPGERGGEPRGGGGPMGRRPGSVSIPNEDEYPMPRGDAAVRELLRAKQHLEIAMSDSGISVKDDAGWDRLLAPEKGKVRDEESQGGAAEVETVWKGEKLVTERRLDRGITIKEVFSLDKKANELVVEVELKMERMPKPVQYRRVYDRVEP